MGASRRLRLIALAAGVRFGCVLADAGYGLSAPFRQGLTERGLAWAVGIPRHQKGYPVGVKVDLAGCYARATVVRDWLLSLGAMPTGRLTGVTLGFQPRDYRLKG